MPRIEELYAYIFEPEEPNKEDIVAVKTELGVIPLVGRKEDVEALRPLALQIAQNSGRQVKLLHFTKREELEILGG